MLSRRNFVMMLTMFGVILVLFLSSAVLKEYFNDYDVNHAVQEESIPRDEAKEELYLTQADHHVIYAGARTTGYYQPILEWAGYRKMSCEEAADVAEAIDLAEAYEKENTYLLISGDALETDTQQAADKLVSYVQKGGIVIFCSLPSYQTIEGCVTLQDLLGIQRLRAESAELIEIRLYKGFLLGDEVCYSFDELQIPERIDMDREIPWYDISSRTKSYMVGFIPAAEKEAQGLNNEDMPALIWRCSTGDGTVFAVNGDYMEGEAALGLLDAMVYEASDYALYGIVNAQNLSVAGYPDLTTENEEIFARVYGFDSRQLCRDVLWPSLVAAASGQHWKITAYVSVKQSNASEKEAEMKDLIEYLKYFNEESAEAGIALGRKGDTDIRSSLAQDKENIDEKHLEYAFSGGYIRSENRNQLSKLLDPSGKMEIFSDIRTVVGEYDPEQPVFSWLTDQITMQSTTIDGYQHTYKDNFRLRSLETSLGYSNVQADMYRVIWPESTEDQWQSVAEDFAASIQTYWKPFAAFEKTTISESDRRLRNFLNQKISSSEEITPEGRTVSIQVDNFTDDAWMMLRTHGETPVSMEGGTWETIEEDAYLLHVTSDTAAIYLQSDLQPYYYQETE